MTDTEDRVMISSHKTEDIREYNNDENKALDEEVIYQRLKELTDSDKLQTLSIAELYDHVFSDRPPVINGLLYTGAYLLAGAPKVGKSFLAAQIAYHVSTGQKLWNHELRQGTVLYLALEDNYRRLQARMSRMFGVEEAANLYFAVDAKQIGSGLIDQMERFIQSHPDTNLIIVDTLQKIREVSKNGASYADDYQVIGTLKQFADEHGICVLIVHHTRKTPAGDKFNMISGTTGLLGCADGALVLLKSSRTENSATLDITGRDQPDQKLYLVRDMDHLTWQYESSEKEEQLSVTDTVLERIAAFMTEDRPTWTGSAAELAGLLGEDIQPNILTRRLNVKHDVMKSDYGICYVSRHTRNGSLICLTKEEQKT